MLDPSPVNTPFYYFDFNATTPLAGEVLALVPDALAHYGNPSSIHSASRFAKTVLRETRQRLAELIGCSPLEIIFTSGGSESNNAIIKSVFFENFPEKNHFLCSSVEHPSVMKTFEWLSEQGVHVEKIPVGRNGFLDLQELEKKITDRTALVSIMAANNETGTLFPIRRIVELAHAKGSLVHTDAVQMLGKRKFSVQDWDVDYASFSAHKFYAPKGLGFIYSKKGKPFQPLIHGGGQERGRRGGTENTLSLFYFNEVLKSRMPQIEEKSEQMKTLRNYFESSVLKNISDVSITALESLRLPNTSSLVIKGVDGETLLMALDLKGFAVSTGAACSSGNPEPSPALIAMGLSKFEAQNSLRISIGWQTTQSEVDALVFELKSVVARLRSFLNKELPL